MKKSTERHIAGLVWKTTFKNRGVYLLILCMVVLFVYAMVTGCLNFMEQNEIREKYQEQARRDWLDNPDKHPHRMAHFGHFAFRPKAPLSVFDLGMESYLGNSVFLEAHVQNTTNFSEAEFSTGMLRFGEIGIAMILQVLMPLLIFFLGFGTIAAERENGTLKMIMAQGIKWKGVLTGKIWGLVLVMATLYLPIIVATGISWIFLNGGKIVMDETLRMLLIAISYFFYLAIFCIISVIVSALCRTSKTALTSLMGIWLLFIVLMPRAGQSLGTYLFRTPSKALFNAQIEKDIVLTGDSHNPDDPYYSSLKDSVLAANKVDSVGQLPFNYGGFIMKEGEKISTEIYNRHLGKLREIYRRQNSFSKQMSFIDPFMGIKNLSMALSGTDYATYVDFQDQAEEYRYHLAQEMNTLQIEHISNDAKGSAGKENVLDREHWAAVEEFEYRPLSVTAVFRNEWPSLLSFPFWGCILFMIIGRISKKLQVL